MSSKKQCKICGKPSHAKRLCISHYNKEYYQRPEVKAYMKEYNQRPEVKAYNKEYYQRPEVKAYRKEYYQRPEVKAYMKVNRKKRLTKLMDNTFGSSNMFSNITSDGMNTKTGRVVYKARKKNKIIIVYEKKVRFYRGYPIKIPSPYRMQIIDIRTLSEKWRDVKNIPK